MEAEKDLLLERREYSGDQRLSAESDFGVPARGSSPQSSPLLLPSPEAVGSLSTPRRFFVFAKAVVGKLEAQGHWADYIDPCSGLPVRPAAPQARWPKTPVACRRLRCLSHPVSRPQMVHREGSAVYGEVDALVTLLGYKTANAGCCKARRAPG